MTTKRVKRWFTIGGLASGIFFMGNLYQPTVVVGESMAPTLEPGRVIWIDRTYYRTRTPKRGEVVVFKHEGAVYVKRVYREPGELLHYVGDPGDWFAPVRETRVGDALALSNELAERHPGLCRVQALRVPDDAVFVIGDNVQVSEDSRQLGPIPLKSIIGRAHLTVDATKVFQYEWVPRKRAHPMTTQETGSPRG
jgi:signal peptidase I